jgi:hypothetical protein
MVTVIQNRQSVHRLEHQLRRLRNRLADAWARGCSKPMIERLEKNMQRRWALLDQARDDTGVALSP